MSKMRQVVAFSALFLTPAWVGAKDVDYITDLPIYDALAPCAARAVSRAVEGQASIQSCPSSVTALQSCVCTKFHDEVVSSISSDVDFWCGDQSSFPASKDHASASTVLAAYCNQDTTTTFPAPAHPVSSYIFELDEYSELARCASIGLSSAVQGNTRTICPPLPTDFAPCACDAEKNSASVSSSIQDAVGYMCSSNHDDISSAQAFFAAYCKMNSGTTSLPTASDPPGDMTYFITEMSQYHSLSTCAQNAVRTAVISQTYTHCAPLGPQDLASCVCIKDKMSRLVSSSMSQLIRYNCQTQVLNNLNSGNDVLDLYCSAARAEVTEDVHVTASHSGAGPTGTADDDGDSKSHGPNAGAIAGAVVGSVVGVLLACTAICFLKRRRRKMDQVKPTDNVPLQNSQRPTVLGGATPSREVSHDVSATGDVITPMDAHDEPAPPPYEAGLHEKMYNSKGN